MQCYVGLTRLTPSLADGGGSGGDIGCHESNTNELHSTQMKL